MTAWPHPDPDSTTLCTDCGTETLPCCPCCTAETYMVFPQVWAAAGMATNGGRLCVGCIEARLGRMLTPADFDFSIPMNRDWGRGKCWEYRSERLLSRMGPLPAGDAA